MIQRSARLQYILLAIVAVLGLIHVVAGNVHAFYSMAQGTTQPELPFYNESSPKVLDPPASQLRSVAVPPGFKLITVTSAHAEAVAAGLREGDAVYTVEGRAYTGRDVLQDQLARHRPGDALSVTFWSHNDPVNPQPAHASIVLRPHRSARPPLSAWLLEGFFTMLPAFCLLTGLYVVFARPRSGHAWIVLVILAYISALFLEGDQHLAFLYPVSLLWRTLGQTAMPVCFMLLGIYFPAHSWPDLRLPWLKWVLVLPTMLLLPIDFLIDFGLFYSFRLAAPVLPLSNLVSIVENSFATLQIGLGFFCLYGNLFDPATPSDSRRRLRILIAGCSIGLVPLFVLLAIALAQHRPDLGSGVPQWIALTVFAMLFVFPLTLAYVVIVQRAMDLRLLVRQGTKYFFARQSILIVGILIMAWLSYSLTLFVSDRAHHRTVDMVQIVCLAALLIAYQSIGSKRLQRLIDQKFFREAFSTEQLLAEISDEARNFTETAPLLQTITHRVGDTLHIARIAVFLRTGDLFHLQLATGQAVFPGVVAALPAASTTIAQLARPNATPANVYRDDPSSWLVDATDAERTVLADLSTELLVPLPGRNRLVGVMALGPKSSEEPYSKTDRQLLQTIASQTGLALENAELLESLTSELAQRASINREIEIAREVQERLFPQSYPKVPGIGLAGYCRPARFVGGDYYDFFLIPQGGEPSVNRLAIAIGDISGKGIPAALLMASLRASLRSVATLQTSAEQSPTRLATLMQHVNRLVYEASSSNRYATFFYAELDPVTRVLTYVNAGHNCPAILRPGIPAIQLEPTGTVVGLLEDATYEQAQVKLELGDTLLAFTDGISEAMTANDEEWGEDRMIAAAEQLITEPGCNRTAQQLLDCLLAQADVFTAGAPQHDDMTLLFCTVA